MDPADRCKKDSYAHKREALNVMNKDHLATTQRLVERDTHTMRQKVGHTCTSRSHTRTPSMYRDH